MYLPMQKRLKTQLNQSEHTPLSTPAVPKEKTLAEVEMKIAGAEKTDMFKNKGIPTWKKKKQKQTKGSGRSKNLPLRRNLPATPEDLINLTRAMSAGNQRGLRPPFPPLHSFMALPVLPDVSEEGAPTRLAGRRSSLSCLYDEESETENGTETSQLPLETAALFREFDCTLDYVISTCRVICDDNIHMCLPLQKRLKTSNDQSGNTPLSTPTVPKEKTLTQIEMQLAGSEKNEMFRNEGIPLRKSKTQYLPKNKPYPGLSEFSSEAPLPENAEKIAAISSSNATTGTGSPSSEVFLIGMHNNNSHEDGDEMLAGHERRKRGAGSSVEGSGLKKAKDVEELPMPVSLLTGQSERQGIGMSSDPAVGRPTGLQIPGLAPKSAGAMGSGPATQHHLEVTQIQIPGEVVMALEWSLQQQVSPQQLPEQQLPVASEERASHPLLMAEGDKTLVENVLATLEFPAGQEEPNTPPANQTSQTLAGQGRPTGLGGPSLAYQAAAGLNANIGSTKI